MRIEVHNISDRPNTSVPPKALVVGGRKLRPGKMVVVESDVLNSKHIERLHGTYLWVGELPSMYARTSRAALAARAEAQTEAADGAPMSHDEVRAYLESRDYRELQRLLDAMSPRVTFKRTPSREALVSRLSRALFKSSFELDPSVFFWLRRWTKNRHGDFVPKE